ncbi:membrane protein DedA, SNARE-associated domain [Klenkia marina]|uniref:Membrane protein DedA, SNARE-associated domain n=1 Tax=Klenkia marina TaxID=1960309 RepID=A0A1G4Y265_9ACTN|nr:DedA family protein [Klenkia marina]SCX47450.1 membrane protein DedA, SNARE-associated domain [Klenkia marina]
MIEWLQGLPPLVVYVTVLLVVGVESVGVPLPGETVLIGAALLAGQGVVSPVTVAVCAALSAAVGDTVGYLLGRRYGDRLFAWAGRRSPKHLGPDKLAAAQALMEKHGTWAVFLGRFVALLRIMAGPLAGSLGMPYRRFAVANWSGAVLWAGATTAVVVALGAAAEELLGRISTGGLVAIAAVAVVAVVVLRVRVRRRRLQRQSDGG